jgi:lipoyl-dependent peroxiredoxin
MVSRTASATYHGLGKDGRGHVSTQSGVLSDSPYGFGTRFEGEPGTNPEELLGAAHASCFTMALSFGLAGAGHSMGTLRTEARVTLEKDGDGFTITRSDLKLSGQVDGIDEAEFRRLADEAKANCPLSKVMRCEITLDVSFG